MATEHFLVTDRILLCHSQVSIVNNVNSAVGPSSIVDKEHVLYGKAYITERLRGLVFEISANSFFQTNTSQVLIDLCINNGIIWDI